MLQCSELNEHLDRYILQRYPKIHSETSHWPRLPIILSKRGVNSLLRIFLYSSPSTPAPIEASQEPPESPYASQWGRIYAICNNFTLPFQTPPIFSQPASITINSQLPFLGLLSAVTIDISRPRPIVW